MRSFPRSPLWPCASRSKAGLGLPARAHEESRRVLHPGPYLKALASPPSSPLCPSPPALRAFSPNLPSLPRGGASKEPFSCQTPSPNAATFRRGRERVIKFGEAGKHVLTDSNLLSRQEWNHRATSVEPPRLCPRDTDPGPEPWSRQRLLPRLVAPLGLPKGALRTSRVLRTHLFLSQTRAGAARSKSASSTGWELYVRPVPAWEPEVRAARTSCRSSRRLWLRALALARASSLPFAHYSRPHP